MRCYLVGILGIGRTSEGNATSAAGWDSNCDARKCRATTASNLRHFVAMGMKLTTSLFGGECQTRRVPNQANKVKASPQPKSPEVGGQGSINQEVCRHSLPW